MAKRRRAVHPMLGKAPGRWENVLTVDPGLGGTGLACWASLSHGQVEPQEPQSTEIIRGGRTGSWEYRVEHIWHIFTRSLLLTQPRFVVLESQALWTGSASSMASAGRGDLFKLAYLTGGLWTIAIGRDAEVVLVSPNQWKGQLPKSAIHKRIKRALGARYPEHVADAVGMGLAVQGVL